MKIRQPRLLRLMSMAQQAVPFRLKQVRIFCLHLYLKR